MIKKIKKFFSTSTEMRIAQKTLKEINKLRSKYSSMSDEELKAQTQIFKERLKDGATLESIRPEVFATAREATRRILKKFPYDVQMVGGVILDLSSVAEMKTGEGKTITSIAPVYLNALEGKGVIVSTVNEYLSERDALEMGQVFNFLGLTVGINKSNMDTNSKRNAYACDITYSIHSELGFDYLRDNMVTRSEDKVQRGLNFVLIDEVDSILIDEAKTPLIISGGQAATSQIYWAADQFVRTLKPEDYFLDLETKSIKLTDEGIDKANSFYKIENLYEIEHSELVHRIQNALRAHKVMKKDVEYIVRDEKIELVDTFTGRIMEGRAYSEGLQQAIQAKEMLEIEPETKTLATITYQNFFRMFKKLSGMTGTAKTEEQEFIDIYNMRVNQVPTNKPIVRIDEKDLIFGSFDAKYKAIVKEIKEKHAIGQPILVGTSQVDESEYLHELLKKEGLPHTVLNAKQNASEAEIISKAGEFGAITIATNMAGRGTDIKPSPEALKVGGLYVLGTDKSESRRIDNQLKGRSGRQGDVGYSRFFLSIEDQLMARFSNYETLVKLYADQGDEPISGKSIHRILNRAQKKIEGFNYDSRKNVLSYDDVIRQQRDLVYTQRDLILSGVDLSHYIERMISRTINTFINLDFILKTNKEINYENLVSFLNDNFSRVSKYHFTLEEINIYHYEQLIDFLNNKLKEIYFNILRVNLVENLSEEGAIANERYIILSALDQRWQNHIDTMDKLRSSSNLVQYSQKNPYQIFTEEGAIKFESLINESANKAVLGLFNNRSAIKVKEYVLSNGAIITLDSDLAEDMVQEIIANAEARIAAEIKLQEELAQLNQEEFQQNTKTFTLSNGKVLSFDVNMNDDLIQQILEEEERKIITTNFDKKHITLSDGTIMVFDPNETEENMQKAIIDAEVAIQEKRKNNDQNL